MAKRDFLAVTDLSREEVGRLFDLARRMKTGAYRETPLAGKSLAMIFAKSSTRTRVSFEVGTYQLGGHALFLSSRDIQLGRGEPIPDTARVLSRYVDGIMIRTFDHDAVDVAGQDPRRVGDRLAPPELDVARRKEEGVSAQLIGADLKGDARAGARLGEDHGQGLAGERRLPISPGLHAAGEVEQTPYFIAAQVGDGEKVALGHGFSHST